MSMSRNPICTWVGGLEDLSQVRMMIDVHWLTCLVGLKLSTRDPMALWTTLAGIHPLLCGSECSWCLIYSVSLWSQKLKEPFEGKTTSGGNAYVFVPWSEAFFFRSVNLLIVMANRKRCRNPNHGAIDSLLYPHVPPLNQTRHNTSMHNSQSSFMISYDFHWHALFNTHFLGRFP